MTSYKSDLPENRCDISRDSLNLTKQFLRVLQQQGRVQTDADFNEQISILLHYLQALAKDIIGPYGVPSVDQQSDSLNLDFTADDTENIVTKFKISGGWRYYVDGVLCEINPDIIVENPKNQNGYSLKFPCLLYLDVWEKTVVALQDNDIYEPALGEVDTAARSQIVWKVRGDDRGSLSNTSDRPTSGPEVSNPGWGLTKLTDLDQVWPDLVASLTTNRGQLKAEVMTHQQQQEACIVPPEAGYRGQENQLYRVEIHHSGKPGKASFKWACDNGSKVFKGEADPSHHAVILQDRRVPNINALIKGAYVEVSYVEMSDGPDSLPLEPPYLLKIQDIEIQDDRGINVRLEPPEDGESPLKNPGQVILRLWDHTEKPNLKLSAGALVVPEAAAVTAGSASARTSTDHKTEKIELENGICISFKYTDTTVFHAGDYWLIPARTAIGGIDWPQAESSDVYEFCRPHGIQHHYAPIALIKADKSVIDCRKGFQPIAVTDKSI